MREEGYYKVKYKTKWEVAECENMDGVPIWWRIARNSYFFDSDFEEIGDKITF